MTDRLECDDCMARAEDDIEEMATCKTGAVSRGDRHNLKT